MEAGAEKRHRSCRSCGVAVQPYWVFCPHCEEPLHDPRQRPSGDRNLGLGQNAGRAERVVGRLALVGLAAINIALMGGVLAYSEGDAEPLFVTLAVLFVLALVSTAIVFTPGKPPGQSKAARIVVVTLSLAGALVAWACLMGAAVVIFFLAVRLAV